jgi:hypothetical protein
VSGRAARAGVFAVAAVMAAIAPAAANATPLPFGHPCTAQYGVRFCPTNELSDRVPTWDDVPIDIDVTLPPKGNGPFPTILMLHPFGGNKKQFESNTVKGAESIVSFYNNNFYAKQGYLVINASARGFGRSCGVKGTREPVLQCLRGYWHYADQRIEIRDAQYMIGKLADEGLVDPKHIGATGVSWGSGQSAMLAFLRNRTRLLNGKFVPWKSPKGTPLAVDAAFARWQWSDLGNALLPNGRFTQTGPSPGPVVYPVGVANTAYIDFLLLAGVQKGHIALPGENPQVNPLALQANVAKGEPYGSNVTNVLNQLRKYSGVTQLAPHSAPLLLQDGWNDDLFEPLQAIRTYNMLRGANKNANISLQFGDVGHPRGSNKNNTDYYFNKQGSRFFAYWLLGKGKKPKPGAVTTFTTTCPQHANGAGPYSASSLDSLAKGAYNFGGTGTQTVSSAGGSTFVSLAFTPIIGTLNACKTAPLVVQPGSAAYRRIVKHSFTLLGLPTVSANIRTAGLYGQLDALLWDVSPSGRQRLVSREGYRLQPNQTGHVQFQLSGNGYRFAAGHIVRLEVGPKDPIVRRKSNGKFRVKVSNLTISMPTLEKNPSR